MTKTIKMGKAAEEAIIEQPTHVMDDILAKSDKFETIRVLMEILCKELGIGVESQPKAIFEALNKVSQEYYEAMERFKNLRQEANNKLLRNHREAIDNTSKGSKNGQK